jgi:hypothetical protein
MIARAVARGLQSNDMVIARAHMEDVLGPDIFIVEIVEEMDVARALLLVE